MRHYFTILLVVTLLAMVSCKQDKNSINLSGDWKFKTGDDMAWAKPEFDDKSWNTMGVDQPWENQGLKHDGYAWYRMHVRIPSSLKQSAYLKDSVLFDLGKIDDADEVFLNGEPIGSNCLTLKVGAYIDKLKDEGFWDSRRRYVLSANDKRIKWNEDNVLAVRVLDGQGLGGMFSGDQHISMMDVKDYIDIDPEKTAFISNDGKKYTKTLKIINHSSKHNFSGKLRISVSSLDGKNCVIDDTRDITLSAGAVYASTIEFNAPDNDIYIAKMEFTETVSATVLTISQDIPYILTPTVSESPGINGPSVYGAGPGKPFLYIIPATGLRPMKFTVNGIPTGLSLNSSTGIISGIVSKAGDYPLTITAENLKGKSTREFTIKIGNTIALTPQLGWNSWNCWGLSVDDAKVKDAVNSFINKGLRDHGWSYINIDDGWEAPERASDGKILTNEKFPDMKALTDYVHANGLKMGIYSSPGPMTCGGFLGSMSHEIQDAQTWADWGIDYLKYDWCSYWKYAKDTSLFEYQKPYKLMRKALDKTNRDIFYSLCQYGMGDVWKWGHEVGGNSWRTTGDITDTWESLKDIGFSQAKSSPFSGPGHWNDPDMLVVGWVGWGPSLHPSRLSPSEQYTHISLWALLSSPLLIGCDLTRLDPFTLNLLTNDEVLAINQDQLGKQAVPRIFNRDYQVWVKELMDGSKAIGIFNLSDDVRKVQISFVAFGMEGKVKARDVWRQKDLDSEKQDYEGVIPKHGVVLLKLSKSK